MSEDSWIKEWSHGDTPRHVLQRAYRSVVEDLINTAAGRISEHATATRAGWPVNAEREFAKASLIRAVIRYAQEMARDSAMASTRRTRADYNLTMAYREFGKADDAFIQYDRENRKPTKAEQAARDAYVGSRTGKRAGSQRKPSYDQIRRAIKDSTNVVPMKQRKKPKDEER